MHWGARQNKLETPKDKDEVNKQDIHECDGLFIMNRFVVYYESIKRELKTKLIYECRCDERLTNEIEESIRLACTVLHDKTN